MKRMLTYGLLLYLPFLVAGPSAADERASAPAPSVGAEGIDAGDLRDGALFLPRWNLRLPAPAPGWSWWALRRSSKDGPRNESFLCLGPAGERFIVTLLENPSGSVDDAFIRGVREGVERTAAMIGMRYSDFQAQRTDVPLAGSYRLSATTEIPNGKGDWVQSISGSDVVYMLQTYLPQGGPTDVFDRFVAGLSLLRTEPLVQASGPEQPGPASF